MNSIRSMHFTLAIMFQFYPQVLDFHYNQPIVYQRLKFIMQINKYNLQQDKLK